MPVITFHLIESAFTDAQHERLLIEASRALADVLDTPIDRTRAFITLYPAHRAAVAGVMVDEGGAGAPFFHFYIGSRRPREHRLTLLARMTDLLVDILGVDRSLIRGYAEPTEPEDWGVAGIPLSVARAGELPPPS